MENLVVAQQFVDFIKSHDWKKETLSDTEAEILLQTIHAAGFEAVKVVPGKLRGNYINQDRDETGETYLINSFCPYKVLVDTVEGKNKDYYFATGWLDDAIRKIRNDARDNDENEAMVENAKKIIEDSRPLEPIQLSAEGDFLLEYPSSSKQLAAYNYLVEHTRDSRTLNTCVGVHDNCEGWMDRNGATKTHDAICCRKCHARFLFPKTVKTYGDLRQALQFEKVATTA